MSANNYLVIRGVKGGYEVWMRDADTGHFLGQPRKAKTLKQALQVAQEWMSEELIEYGIRQIDL